MATTKDELWKKFVEWRASLSVKGLKVNAERIKLTVGEGSGGVVSELGAWPCVVPCKNGLGRTLSSASNE